MLWGTRNPNLLTSNLVVIYFISYISLARRPMYPSRGFHQRRPFGFGDRRPFINNRRPYDENRRPFDGERRPFDGERRPFDENRRNPLPFPPSRNMDRFPREPRSKDDGFVPRDRPRFSRPGTSEERRERGKSVGHGPRDE